MRSEARALQFFFPATLQGRGFVLDGCWGEEILAFQQEGQGEVREQIGGSIQEGAKEGHNAVQFGDGSVDHGRDDVGIESLSIKEIRNAEDKLLTVEIKLKAAECKLLIGAHEKFGSRSEVGGFRGEGTLSYDGEGVKLGEGLGMQLNVSVVRLEVSLQDLTTFHRFAVPALLAKGLRNGLQLKGRRRVHAGNGA